MLRWCQIWLQRWSRASFLPSRAFQRLVLLIHEADLTWWMLKGGTLHTQAQRRQQLWAVKINLRATVRKEQGLSTCCECGGNLTFWKCASSYNVNTNMTMPQTTCASYDSVLKWDATWAWKHLVKYEFSFQIKYLQIYVFNICSEINHCAAKDENMSSLFTGCHFHMSSIIWSPVRPSDWWRAKGSYKICWLWSELQKQPLLCCKCSTLTHCCMLKWVEKHLVPIISKAFHVLPPALTALRKDTWDLSLSDNILWENEAGWGAAQRTQLLRAN